jgi:hypothetical protein
MPEVSVALPDISNIFFLATLIFAILYHGAREEKDRIFKLMFMFGALFGVVFSVNLCFQYWIIIEDSSIPALALNTTAVEALFLSGWQPLMLISMFTVTLFVLIFILKVLGVLGDDSVVSDEEELI